VLCIYEGDYRGLLQAKYLINPMISSFFWGGGEEDLVHGFKKWDMGGMDWIF
jgi:hypothetical protein